MSCKHPTQPLPFLCTYLLDSSQLFLMVHCNTSGVRTPGRTSPLAIIAELSEAATAVVVTCLLYTSDAADE